MMNSQFDLKPLIQELTRQGYITDTSVTNKGQFAVLISDPGGNKCVGIFHGAHKEDYSFEKPGIIEVILSDAERRKSFGIYMTECELPLFPSLLDEARVVTEAFFNNFFRIIPPKKFSIFNHKLVMQLDTITTYRVATETKQYFTFVNMKKLLQDLYTSSTPR